MFTFLAISQSVILFFWGGVARRLRAFCVRQFIEYCGENVNIERGASIPSGLCIGDNSGVGINSSISGPCSIGNNVMMGPECVILTRNHRFDDVDIPMIKQGYTETKGIVIEDDVWIGRRVIILPGVKIGKGSIIGAGSVVTHDIEPFTINAGNPCRKIRSRLVEKKNFT